MQRFGGLFRSASRLLAGSNPAPKCRGLVTCVRSTFTGISTLHHRFITPTVNTTLMNKIGPVRTMANHKHKKIIKLAKGFRGRANRCFRTAVRRVQKARKYAYIGRKLKKRDMRSLWIQRMNAACRIHGITYNNFIHRLNQSNVKLNRKVLSDLANTEPLSFRSIIDVVQKINGK